MAVATLTPPKAFARYRTQYFHKNTERKWFAILLGMAIGLAMFFVTYIYKRPLQSLTLDNKESISFVLDMNSPLLIKSDSPSFFLPIFPNSEKTISLAINSYSEWQLLFKSSDFNTQNGDIYYSLNGAFFKKISTNKTIIASGRGPQKLQMTVKLNKSTPYVQNSDSAINNIHLQFDVVGLF